MPNSLAKIDYVRLYRIGDESLDKEIFQFIKNHDIDYVTSQRDFKLCEILQENYVDSLFYLNEFIDIIKPYWNKTMVGPQINYISPLTMRSRSLQAGTQLFKSMSDIRHWFHNFKKDIFPYYLEIDYNSIHKYTFRYVQIDREDILPMKKDINNIY